jgi:hypothetical protein
MAVTERPDPTPEGQLIADALAKSRPKLALREAARRAGISEARWRQIAAGYVMVSGEPSVFSAPAETLARMARTVGVTSAQLREAGRADAADALQDLLLDEKYAGASTAEILAETERIAAKVADLLKAQGKGIGPRQERVINRWAATLIQTLNEFEENNDVG